MKLKQLQELKNSTEQELMHLLDQKQKNMFVISSQKRLAALKNPLTIRELRRDIARIKTIYRARFNKKI